jgi:predicted lactoylglutathione lyase
MKLPMPVPEIPVTDVRAAADAYQRQMGFNVDWTYEDYLAGITKDDARLYLRRRSPEEDQARYAVLVWLNMASAAEVDELHARWTERGVRIVKELQTAPYGLREFTAEDLDGNRIRVFFVRGA